MRAAKVETFEPDYEQRERDRETASSGKRLAQSHIEDFRLFWCEVPSRLGLHSNMGSQIQRLEQRGGRPEIVKRGPKEKVAKTRKAKRAPTMTDALVAHLEEAAPDELATRAADELAAWRADVPVHVELDLPPEELPEVRVVMPSSGVKREGRRFWNARDGLHGDERPGDIRAAYGVQTDYIHCGSADVGSGACMKVAVETVDENRVHSVELVEAPNALESYCDPWSGPATDLRRRVSMCRRALARMVRQGDAELVGVLFRMYGGAMPESEFKAALGKEGDLAPLLVDTRTVLAHAAMMTRKLRASLGATRVHAGVAEPCRTNDGKGFHPANRTLEHWVPSDVRRLNRKETVTPHTAARDLFDKTKGESGEREELRLNVRREARAILIDASQKYEIAHAIEVQAAKIASEKRRAKIVALHGGR